MRWPRSRRERAGAIGSRGMRALRIGAFVVAGFGLLLLVAGVAFGPLVHGRVAREAAARGVVVAYGAARLRFGGIELPRRGPSGSRGRGELRVASTASSCSWRFPLHLDGVEVRGGEVVATGDADSILSAVSEWRSKRPPSADRETGAARTPVRLDGVAAIWRSDDGAVTGEARGVSVARDVGLAFGAESVDGALGLAEALGA